MQMFLVLFWWWSVFGGPRGSSPVCAQISDQRPDWSEAAAEGAPQEGAERTQQLLSPHWLWSGYPTAARADSEPHGQPMRGEEGGRGARGRPRVSWEVIGWLKKSHLKKSPSQWWKRKARKCIIISVRTEQLQSKATLYICWCVGFLWILYPSTE